MSKRTGPMPPEEYELFQKRIRAMRERLEVMNAEELDRFLAEDAELRKRLEEEREKRDRVAGAIRDLQAVAFTPEEVASIPAITPEDLESVKFSGDELARLAEDFGCSPERKK